MTNLSHLLEPGQVILNVFDCVTRTITVFAELEQKLVAAPESESVFYPVKLFDVGKDSNFTIGRRGQVLIKPEAFKTVSSRKEITDRLLKHLYCPDIKSIDSTFYTAPHTSKEFVGFVELKAIFVYHFPADNRLADIKDGILVTWPEEYNGKDPRSKVIYHRQTPPAPKPVQVPKPETAPHLSLVPDLKPFKPDRRKKRKAPLSVLKYFSWLAVKSKWIIVFKAMFSLARYGDITKDKFYAGKKSHMGRWYSYGIETLVNATGLNEKTVRRGLALMLKHHIIRRRKQGFKGFGNAIYELPFNLAQAMYWKKKHKT